MGAVLARSITLTHDTLQLPFSSAHFGRRPRDPRSWTLSRANRPLGRGNTLGSLAAGMYRT